MKKIGIILVAGMVLMAALMGAAGSGEGEYAEVSCEEHERFMRSSLFFLSLMTATWCMNIGPSRPKRSAATSRSA